MDTIASVATALGASGIAIIRISGENAKNVLNRVFVPKSGKPMKNRYLTYGNAVLNGNPLDECMAVFMPAPHTYTTEDVAEIQCHGGSVTANAVLSAVLQSGARLAEPGEFTKRAFLGGRIDLSQAESVMDLISARTQEAARSGLRQMKGFLSKRIHALQSRLLDTIAYLEAFLDYPDEDIEDLTADKARAEVLAVQSELQSALKNAKAGKMLNNGVRIVLCGSPNTGKSSLLNALLREQRAIVTDVPGTTRDVLREQLNLNGLPVQLIDTAGLRQSPDTVERIGIDLARQEVDSADVVLLVLDGTREPDTEEKSLILRENLPLVIALNKSDLKTVLHVKQLSELYPGARIVVTSAKCGNGVEELRETLYETALHGASPEDAYLTNERHIEAARNAVKSLDAALSALSTLTLDCAALDLRNAWETLGSITGENTTEDVIDRIFAKFCLGK